MAETTTVQTRLRFERRPSPVLAEHRPLYKISQVLLVLRLSSRGGKSSLARLHLFNWALKRMDRIQRVIEASTSGDLHIQAWGFDPALAIALRYSLAEDLVRSLSTGYQITVKGESFADAVVQNVEVFVAEKLLLKEIGKNITEAMVEKVAKGWGTS